MPWAEPTVSEFKDYFARDFNYAPTNDATNLSYVTDTDITKAINVASMTFNKGLFSKDEYTTIAFLYLAAYFLVSTIQTSAQGLSSQSNFPISSKNAGPLSISYAIPERYTKDPIVQPYTMNGYGMRYLSLVLPRIVGQADVVDGTTTVG